MIYFDAENERRRQVKTQSKTEHFFILARRKTFFLRGCSSSLLFEGSFDPFASLGPSQACPVITRTNQLARSRSPRHNDLV